MKKQNQILDSFIFIVVMILGFMIWGFYGSLYHIIERTEDRIIEIENQLIFKDIIPSRYER